MLQDWIDHATDLSLTKADFFHGCRKIIRGVTLDFDNWDDDLHMPDVGFTKSKTSALMRNYYNEESIKAAMQLWTDRSRSNKYGSVGICTYNHYIKSGAGKDKSVDEFLKARGKSRGSIMGPCIQSIMLTYIKRGEAAIDVTYRTTEFFKKFPADLVFMRDQVLPQFNLPKVSRTRMYFANVTMHPMYFVTMAPHMQDPIAFLEKVRKKDPRFWEWIVKWTARYLVPKYARGIDKFAQAVRVRDDAKRRLEPYANRALQRYLTKNHPGIRGEMEEDNED